MENKDYMAWLAKQECEGSGVWDGPEDGDSMLPRGAPKGVPWYMRCAPCRARTIDDYGERGVGIREIAKLRYQLLEVKMMICAVMDGAIETVVGKLQTITEHCETKNPDA